MNVTLELIREHELIVLYLNLLEKTAKHIQLENKDSLMNDIGLPICNFLSHFADNYHHKKEEDILFETLNSENALNSLNPIPMMLDEHDLGRNHLRIMKDAIHNKDCDLFCSHALDYSDLLEHHIFKEDNVLYPMAEDALSEYKKIEIQNRYEDVEKDFDKNSIWPKYEKLLNELTDLLQT